MYFDAPASLLQKNRLIEINPNLICLGVTYKSLDGFQPLCIPLEQESLQCSLI